MGEGLKGKYRAGVLLFGMKGENEKRVLEGFYLQEQ
jgi:hypothetical protein